MLLTKVSLNILGFDVLKHLAVAYSAVLSSSFSEYLVVILLTRSFYIPYSPNI